LGVSYRGTARLLHTVINLQVKYMSAAKMKLVTDTGILLTISQKMKQ
jgi:hypothetical protein